MLFNPQALSSASVQDLARTVQSNLRLLSELLNGPNVTLQFEPLPAAPSKPREGMVAWANGTNWNPGAGAGLYEYRSGAWNKL